MHSKYQLYYSVTKQSVLTGDEQPHSYLHCVLCGLEHQNNHNMAVVPPMYLKKLSPVISGQDEKGTFMRGKKRIIRIIHKPSDAFFTQNNLLPIKRFFALIFILGKWLEPEHASYLRYCYAYRRHKTDYFIARLTCCSTLVSGSVRLKMYVVRQRVCPTNPFLLCTYVHTYYGSRLTPKTEIAMLTNISRIFLPYTNEDTIKSIGTISGHHALPGRQKNRNGITPEGVWTDTLLPIGYRPSTKKRRNSSSPMCYHRKMSFADFCPMQRHAHLWIVPVASPNT